VVKWLAAALTAVLAAVVPSSAAFGQTAPSSDPPPSGAPTTTAPPAPAPSLPPGLPTVTPPTVPSTDPEAPPPEPEPPLPDPSPQVAILMAHITLLNARQVLDLSQAAFMIATASEEKVSGARDAAQHDYDIKRSRLTDAVSNAYVRGTGADGTTGLEDDYLPTASAHLLVGTALQHAEVDVHVATDRLQIADRTLAQAKARASQAGVARDYAQAAYDDATDASSKAARVSRSKDASPTVLGDAVMTADELVGWYKSEGIVGYTAAVDLPTLAGAYLDEAKAELVRGDVAFAQSIVETGAFTSPLTTHNNFAGIGACDTCATGFDFQSPQMGVRAQVQLLHAYADNAVRAKTLANPPIGSDPDTLSVRGCCHTWNALTGTWASDPNYGPKLMTVYLSMLEYTLVVRTQAASGSL